MTSGQWVLLAVAAVMVIAAVASVAYRFGRASKMARRNDPSTFGASKKHVAVRPARARATDGTAS